ncbi:MAG: alginate lyase family protein, partial [Desulfobacteraceae bacterium]|nr:alginate lyase family protein [Desulfobacteraceae bacterium]
QPESFLQSHKTNGRRFFFQAADLPRLQSYYQEKLMPQAEEILRNRFQYFFHETYDLGSGPDWFLNPATGKWADPCRHWCDIDVFDPSVGDIKFIWEPSRFAWVYTLVRAFAATGDDKYAQRFWQLFESWLESNQPNQGPNYVCGQECAIRLMAMCFAFFALAEADASTVERKTTLAIAIAIHAERIEKNISFAISTRTNHSITEAAGLYTAGLLFPEFRHSQRWLRLGKKILTDEGVKQIYADGSYVQHSMNYHRLMLQDFLWVLRLAQLNDDSFSEDLTSRVAKATEFLYQMQDQNSGRLPNYGANDGALILPLNSCDYLDYRPVLQAAKYLLDGVRLYEPGPWDEDLLWLFGPKALTSRLKPETCESKAYESRGYYTLRNEDNWAMMRCHSFTERPGHSDMLHLDLWWKGRNILRDSGSYMYTCDEPWQSYFASTAAHNTIAVDDAEQMTKASRFMWFDWTKAKLTTYNSGDCDGTKVMQGEHYGYCRNGQDVIHRRAVLSWEQTCWLIVDDVLGLGTHNIELFWQLCDLEHQLSGNVLTIKTEDGPVCLAVLTPGDDVRCECSRGDDRPIGWQSLYYGTREPAPTLVCSKRADLPVRLVTLVSLGNRLVELQFNEERLLSWRLERTAGKFQVELNSLEAAGTKTFIYTQQNDNKVYIC